jgi:hypothetical protein
MLQNEISISSSAAFCAFCGPHPLFSSSIPSGVPADHPEYAENRQGKKIHGF